MKQGKPQPKLTGIYFVHEGTSREGLTAEDMEKAIGILDFLDRAQSGLLSVPGVAKALPRTPKRGSHLHPAFLLVEEILYTARGYCKKHAEALKQ